MAGNTPRNNLIRTFVHRNVERQLVKEYLLRENEAAGFGDLVFQRTPEGTKVTLYAENLGRVIGRRGHHINELSRRLVSDFELDNPRLEVDDLAEPRLSAQVMASRLSSSLERGWFFRRAGHSTVMNIMAAGAKGCLVVLNGKITGARHRTQKFQAGHIKYCGETAFECMDFGYSVAVKKLGTVGCTVGIMRPGAKLPHEITVHSREEVGLEPLSPTMRFTIEESSEESFGEAAPSEDSAPSPDEVASDAMQLLAEFEAKRGEEE